MTTARERYIIDRFDHELPYDKWHKTCQAAFRRTVVPLDGALRTRGYEKIRVLSRDTAAEIRSRLEGPEAVWHGDRHQHATLASPDLLLTAFDEIFGPAVDARISALYGAEYMVKGARYRRTLPAADFAGTDDADRDEDSKVSFLWHRDGGPSTMLVMLVYLDDTDDSGGGTECVDIETTRALAEAGYDFPPVTERTVDLAPLAREAGIDFVPVRPRMEAGEALVVRVRDVLHRAVMPDRAPRTILHLGLVPALFPWRRCLDLWPLERLQGEPTWAPEFIPLMFEARADGDRGVA